MKTIKLRSNVMAENNRIAQKLRETYEKKKLLVINIIGSPGCGKTSLLEETIKKADNNFRTMIIVGDVQTEYDAERLKKVGADAYQIETMGICHLDARMLQKKIQDIRPKGTDLLIIENVGNLVCPAGYDLGEDSKVVMVSVPEGDEKPLKYPAIFHRADLFLITKIDMLENSNFNLDRAVQNAKKINPDIKAIPMSSKTGEGMNEWFSWLEGNISRKKGG